MLDLFVRSRWMLRMVLGNEEGQDLVEYALVVGLISIAAVAGLQNAATAVNGVITSITGALNSAA